MKFHASLALIIIAAVGMVGCIGSVNPSSGPVGTSVTLTGASFGNTQGTSTVSFNGVVASPTNWTTTSITVPVPSGATTGNVVVTVLGVSGNSVNFTVTQAAPAGQFMVLSADKTHLVNTITNKPVFIMGEDAFSMIGQLSNAEIEIYFADRASRGFNLVWIGAVDNTYSVNRPDNALGQAPFGGSPFTNMQEPYFEHLDYVIQRAGAYGITVLLNPAFSGFFCDDASGWCPELEAASDATLTAYGTYLGNRYKSYPNIVWLIGGDLNIPFEGDAIRNKQNDIALGIKSADTVHLMTVENIRGQSALDEWSGASWLDLNDLYNLPQDFPAAANSNYLRSDFLPFFEMEDYYEGEHSMTEVGLRTEAYWAVLGGAYLGQTFGNNAIWNFGDPAYDVIGPWQDQLASVGAVGRELLGKLFRSREHWKMVPDIAHMVVTAGYGTGDSLTTTARTSDGQTIIAYIPKGNATTITVDMTQITSSTKLIHGWWFNPQTGLATDLGTYGNTGTQAFTPPDANDWVLVLDDANAGLPAPGSTDL